MRAAEKNKNISRGTHHNKCVEKPCQNTTVSSTVVAVGAAVEVDRWQQTPHVHHEGIHDPVDEWAQSVTYLFMRIVPWNFMLHPVMLFTCLVGKTDMRVRLCVFLSYTLWTPVYTFRCMPSRTSSRGWCSHTGGRSGQHTGELVFLRLPLSAVRVLISTARGFDRSFPSTKIAQLLKEERKNIKKETPPRTHSHTHVSCGDRKSSHLFRGYADGYRETALRQETIPRHAAATH